MRTRELQRLTVKELHGICDKIGFKDLNSGFDKLEDGKVVRQILIPSM